MLKGIKVHQLMKPFSFENLWFEDFLVMAYSFETAVIGPVNWNFNKDCNLMVKKGDFHENCWSLEAIFVCVLKILV